MKIIDRYIGMSVMATAFFGVVVLSLVLVLGNLFKQLLDVLINNPDVPIATVLAFMALVLPFSLTFTIPWGFLTAAPARFWTHFRGQRVDCPEIQWDKCAAHLHPGFRAGRSAFGNLLLDQHRGGAAGRAANDEDDCRHRHQQSSGPLSC